MIQLRRADLGHWLARARYGSSDNRAASHALAASIHLRPTDRIFRSHHVQITQPVAR